MKFVSSDLGIGNVYNVEELYFLTFQISNNIRGVLFNITEFRTWLPNNPTFLNTRYDVTNLGRKDQLTMNLVQQ